MIDLTPYKVLAFDADNTLRRCTIEGQPCPNKSGEWELLPHVRETMQGIDWDRHGAAIVSNQAGIAAGYLTAEVAWSMLMETARQVWAPRVPRLFSVHYCPHAVNGGCSCRKPQPGLLYALCHYHCVRPSEILFVGDMKSDEECAKNAGAAFLFASEFFQWKTEAHASAPPPKTGTTACFRQPQ